MLADRGFWRDDDRIWRHPDRRAIGEGVMSALIDAAFLRFLGLDPAELSQKGARKSKAVAKSRKRRRGAETKQFEA